MRRYIPPLLFGIGGVAVLLALGVWQMQRLEWKRGILAEIEARVAAAPVALPSAPDAEAHRYLPVRAIGTTGADELHVLVSIRGVGPGYRIVTPFATEGRVILLDRGFVRETEKDILRPPKAMTVTGNLHWPEEIDRFTPKPDLGRNIWFARDVSAMAGILETEPVLLIARTVSETGPPVMPLPVDTSGIPNDHLEYAITWFSLAAVWAGMTLFLLSCIKRKMV